MKLKKQILLISAIALISIAAILIIFFLTKKDKKGEDTETTEKPQTTDISYQEDVKVEELKELVGATADTNIYVVEEEYDGRKALVVKRSILYKTMLAGVIKGKKPETSELDAIVKQKEPKEKGIWIESKARETFLKQIQEVTQNEYEISQTGYLKIKEVKKEQNENDNRLEKIIKGNKTIILDISGIAYTVDNLTGMIEEYPFEKMDAYQTYEYVEDGDKMVVILTKNEKQKLSNQEIITSVLEILHRW